jgi:replication factor C large subunit
MHGKSTKSALWTVEHAPKSVEEVAGNDEIRDFARQWAAEIQRGRKQQPLLLWGPPGVGKSALAISLANDAGWTVIETNAGDVRDKESLAKLLGVSNSSRGLFGEMRLILIDELDAAFDRGEIPALSQIIKEANQPIILTANDPWNPKLADLRSGCKMLEMRRVNSVAIAKVLDRIAHKENVAVARETASEIASRVKGDVRAAVNDLQALCEGTGEGQAVASAGSSFAFYREREEGVFDAVRNVFKSRSFNDALHAGDNVDEDLETLVEYISENIVKEYFDHELPMAMAWLSKSDVYAGRVRRRRHYELMKYQRALALAGVGASKDSVHEGFVAYSYPRSLKMLSTTKKSRNAISSIAAKIACRTHSSSYEAKRSTLPLLAHVLTKEKAAGALGLNDEEAAALRAFYEPIEGKAPKRKKR